jgi:hypothetical protein
MSRARLGLACTSLLFVIACGSTARTDASPTPTASPTTAPTPTPSLGRAALQQQYLNIMGPAGEALRTYEDEFHALGSNLNAAKLQPVCAKTADALQSAIDSLLQASWPPNVAPDIRALATADQATVNDMRHCGMPTLVAWTEQLARDGAPAAAAEKVIFSDLGLPPP